MSAGMPDCPVTVVLPCLNEAESLPTVLTAVPAGYRALVVDNNSTDATAEVARRHGADVVSESRPGYGSAVHAGVVGATTPIVAVLDGDGSLDPADLPRLVAELERGADMVTGRRRAGSRAEMALACAVGNRRGVLAAAQRGTTWPSMTSLRCGWRAAMRCWAWE